MSGAEQGLAHFSWILDVAAVTTNPIGEPGGIWYGVGK